MMTLNDLASLVRLVESHFPETPEISFAAYRESELKNLPYALGSFVLLQPDYRIALANLAVPRKVSYNPATGLRLQPSRALLEGVQVVRGWIIPGLNRPVKELRDLNRAFLEEVFGPRGLEYRIRLNGAILKTRDIDVRRRAFLRTARAEGYYLSDRSQKWLKSGLPWEDPFERNY